MPGFPSQPQQTCNALNTPLKSLHHPPCSPFTTGLPVPEPIYHLGPRRWHPSSCCTDGPPPPGTLAADAAAQSLLHMLAAASCLTADLFRTSLGIRHPAAG